MIGPSSAGPSPPPAAGPSDGGRPRPLAGRILWISLAVSALLHIAVLFLYPGWMRSLDPYPEPGSAAPPPPSGMEVMTLRIVPHEEGPEPEVPPPEEEPYEPPEEPLPQEADAPDEEETVPAPRRRTAAERLRPQEGDPRLWSPLEPALTELTDAEREALELAGRLEEWNDSVLAAREADARYRDWTYTDGEGRRWGVSPGRVHLGDLTLPMGFELGSPQQRAESERLQRDWEEIERGAVETLRRETLKERARAMRERRDREQADSTSSDP